MVFVCVPLWLYEPGARQSTVPHESCGEQANEVSGQMMALSCCLREAMAQRASCRVLSVLCVCPALSATKGSLARQCCGIRWTRPLLPSLENCELEPLRAVSGFECLVGSCAVFKTLTNKCHFIRLTLRFIFSSSLASLYLPFSLFCLRGSSPSCFLLLVFVFSLSCLSRFVLRCNL